jgi:C4-dicarboxylate-specific signal transduction histidine kinase
MAKVVKEVLDFVTAEAHQKLVKLHHQVPADVPNTMGDAIQIEQVLLNLVRNAMDAVVELEETRRHIFLSAQKQRDGWLTMEIRDRGRGCPADMADRLFEPFVTSRKEGLGIGLSISQGIVEAHGGRLWLAKNSKTGAVFRFTLPTASSSGEKAKA